MIKEVLKKYAIELCAGAVTTAISALLVSNYAMMQKFDVVAKDVADLKASSYNTEYNEIRYELAGETTSDDILAAVEYWVEDQKGSKLGSMSTLCSETGRVNLIRIMDENTAIAACRIVGAG